MRPRSQKTICGTRAQYASGCRCSPCRQANANYQNGRRHGRLANPLVPVDEVLRHLNRLKRSGVGRRTVSDLSGVNVRQLVNIKQGRQRRMTTEHATAILSIKAKDALPEGRLVDAGPTWRRLDELIALGFTKVSLARKLGFVGQGLHIRKDRIRVRNAMKVERLYDELISEGELIVPSLRSENTQLIRQWKIVRDLTRRRYMTIADCAVEHEVDEKTIRRDIADLAEAGFPIGYIKHDEGQVMRLQSDWLDRCPA